MQEAQDLDESLFVESETRRVVMPDEALRALCLRSTRAFLPDRAEAAPILATLLKDHLNDGKPASLLRVGDGEGNALALTRDPFHPIYLNAFNDKFCNQVGILEEDEARMLCLRVRQAFNSADTLGFRSIDPLLPEIEIISNALMKGRNYAAVGILYAREFLQDQLLQGRFGNKTLTSAWVHLALIPYIVDIMDAASAVIVVSGRAALKPNFESRLGTRLRSFISVPPEDPGLDQGLHYRETFACVLDALSTDLRGTLVLVGAGLLGKLYCERATQNGAVALDLGSAFDVLAGIRTRPVHMHFNVDELRWI
jgi:hypothetical protein